MTHLDKVSEGIAPHCGLKVRCMEDPLKLLLETRESRSVRAHLANQSTRRVIKGIIAPGLGNNSNSFKIKLQGTLSEGSR
jgi:hypothetical protein